MPTDLHEKLINQSSFGENMTTSKRSSIPVHFRNEIPDNRIRIATKISGVVTIYDSAVDATGYADVVNGELILKAPPGLGDMTYFFTKRHSAFFPNNGKRLSSSMFYDTPETGDHEIGFCNFELPSKVWMNIFQFN